MPISRFPNDVTSLGTARAGIPAAWGYVYPPAEPRATFERQAMVVAQGLEDVEHLGLGVVVVGVAVAAHELEEAFERLAIRLAGGPRGRRDGIGIPIPHPSVYAPPTAASIPFRALTTTPHRLDGAHPAGRHC